MKTTKNAEKINYTPPLLGNGSLSVMLDYCGRQGTDGRFDDVKYCTPEICVWLAGRRYRYDTVPERSEDKRYTLIPFGAVGEKINGEENPEPSDWEQTLDVENGYMKSKCKYDCLTVSTRAYVHFEYDMLSVKKTFDSAADYSFVYKLKGADGKKIERFDYKVKKINNGIAVSYSIDGRRLYNGGIYIFSDVFVNAECKDDEIHLSGHFGRGESASMFVLYCDDFERADYAKYLSDTAERVLKNPEKEFEESCKCVNDYMNISYISCGDKKINSVYKTAQYHLKTLSTKWSLPMGINNAMWHGAYFAFDEIFITYALLSSNHTFEAYKISKFRYDILDKAIHRVSSKNVKQANYFCESLEDGEDGGVPGYWCGHIFHNTSVVLGFWEYYNYTKDINFLKNMAHPVAKMCAAFFMNNMVYKEESGKTVITACTDLERLGASVKNAYMTTCSAIKLFEIFYNISLITGEDKDFAKQCLDTANALRKYLPNDGEKYIPYPGCTDKSIGVLSGCFPYSVQKRDDKLQKNAIDDFVSDELTFGNMYQVGNHISSWYAAWKAAAYAELRDDKVYASLKQANESAGCFAEMFEINEKGCVFRPWFTTAAGAYIYAANRMFVQREDDIVYIAPALPKEEKSFAFSLAVCGNLTVCAEVSNSELCGFYIKSKGGKTENIKVCIPGHIDVSKMLENGTVKKTNEENIYICSIISEG